MVTFISNIAHKVNTLCKEFIHGIITNIDNGNGNFTKKNRKDLEKIQNFQQTDSGSEKDITVKSPEKEK